MNKRCFSLIIICICFYLSASYSSEVAKVPDDELKIENIMNRKFMERFSVPQFEWLNDGRILLYEKTNDGDDMALVIFEPVLKKRIVLAKMSEVIESMRNFLKDETPKYLGFPDAIDTSGSAVAYLILDDIFMVRFNPVRVSRLTETKEKEEAIAFSPDGNWISFIRGTNIYAIDTLSGAEKQLTFDGTETLLNGKLSWVYWEELYNHAEVPYQWSPDSASIAYLQTDESNVPTHTFVHYKPVIPEVVVQRYPKVGQINPTVRLGIVNIKTTKTIWMNCGTYEYIAGFKWLPEAQKISIATLNRKQNELKLFFSNPATGESQLIIEEHQDPWINLIDMPYFLRNKEIFLWLSERDTHSHIYSYDYKGHLLNQITRGNFNVNKIVGSLMSKKDAYIYFISNKDSLRERNLYRIDLKGKKLQKISYGSGFHSISFSEKYNLYLDTYSSISMPPSLVLYDADGKAIYTIKKSAVEEVEKLHFIVPEFTSYVNKDGVELPAIMVKPYNFESGKKYPVILYVYGGPGAQQVIDVWSVRHLWSNILAREGYFVVTLELRAGLNSSKVDENTQYKRAYGIPNLNDILSAVEWLSGFSFIDKERIGIWGWSGGGSTTLFALTHSNVFKAGIAVAPVSDLKFYDTIYMERYMKTPDDNADGYEETSSVAAAENLKAKLLIVHGTYDDNVHPQNTFAFIDKLIDKNIQFELMIYPWRQHGIYDTPARIHLYTMMLNFWKKYL